MNKLLCISTSGGALEIRWAHILRGDTLSYRYEKLASATLVSCGEVFGVSEAFCDMDRNTIVEAVNKFVKQGEVSKNLCDCATCSLRFLCLTGGFLTTNNSL